jgi:hypothetical protein
MVNTESPKNCSVSRPDYEAKLPVNEPSKHCSGTRVLHVPPPFSFKNLVSERCPSEANGMHYRVGFIYILHYPHDLCTSIHVKYFISRSAFPMRQFVRHYDLAGCITRVSEFMTLSWGSAIAYDFAVGCSLRLLVVVT